MNICIITSTDSDDEARELLRLLGMPFQADERSKGAA
jgi:ribosomal protein L5